MDGALLILASWFAVVLLCYFFILAFNRRNATPIPSIRVEEHQESINRFPTDFATWLFWGLDENARNEQKLAPVIEKFIVKSLNESSVRLYKESNPAEIRFDSIHLHDKSIISAFHNFNIHPNRTSATSHMSINAKMTTSSERNGPVRMRITMTEPDDQGGGESRRQKGFGNVPVLKSPSVRKYSIQLLELDGDIEVRVASIAGELFVIGCFKGKPNVQLELQESVNESKKDFLLDISKRCICSAVLNFSIGELLYPDTEVEARASRARLSAEFRDLSFMQELYDNPPEKRDMSPKFPTSNKELIQASVVNSTSAKYLQISLLEVIKLQDSSQINDRCRYFVCIDLDEPHTERFLSPKAHSDEYQTDRIFWNDNEAIFEFQMSPASGGELLFELYSEEDYPQQEMYNTVRRRNFIGMGILSVSELKQIIGQQSGLVRLQLLHEKPEMGGNKDYQKLDKLRGILSIKCAFAYRQEVGHRTESVLDNQTVEYAQIQKERSSGSGHEEQQRRNKNSIGTIGGGSMSLKRLPRQKHYIYSVTDDRPEYNGSYTESPEKRSSPKISIDTSGERISSKPKYEDPTYSILGIPSTSKIHKTVSDTNALFQFEGQVERKRSAPETPISASKHKQMELEKPRDVGADQQRQSPEDSYDHLFNGDREKVHPAMEIFKMPPELQEKEHLEETEEIGRRARERDREAHGRKQRRNFFDQIKARLSGPVQFFSRKHGKRARSLDDGYEQPHLEEAPQSMPQSRDQSQTRYGRERRDSNKTGQKLFVKSTDLTASTSNLQQHSQQTSKRTLLPDETQLILELIGPEGPRYYYIPMEMTNEPAVVKLMQSGKKLHVYRNHILVASKTRGRVICSVCHRRIGSGAFSNRQAYQCRDCRIICHKSCHRQIDWICENSTFYNLAEGSFIEEVDWTEFSRHHQLREFISIGNL